MPIPDERTVYCFIVAVYVALCSLIIVWWLGRWYHFDSFKEPSRPMVETRVYVSRDKPKVSAEASQPLPSQWIQLPDHVSTPIGKDSGQVSGLRPPPELIRLN